MKKIYSMSFLFAALAFNATAQKRSQNLARPMTNQATTALEVPDFITKTQINKRVTGSITCQSNYQAGATNQTLNFTLVMTNTDAEYGDFLEMTFPAGITPVSSVSDPIAPITDNDPSQSPEALNPISGQVISWGDDDNTYGGIEPYGPITFSVVVNVAGGLTGIQTVTYHLSGDQFGNDPADLYSSVSIYPTGSVDAEAMVGYYMPGGEYLMLPVSQLEDSVILFGAAGNVGGDTIPAGVEVDFTLNGGSPIALYTQNPIAPSEFEVVTAGYSPMNDFAYGINQFIVTTLLANDIEPTNDADTTVWIITDSTLSRDFGPFFIPTLSRYNGASGLINPLDSFSAAQMFQVFNTDTITSVSWFATYDQDMLGKNVKAYIYTAGADSTPDSILRKTLNYTVSQYDIDSVSANSSISNLITSSLDSDLVVTPGLYFVVYKDEHDGANGGTTAPAFSSYNAALGYSLYNWQSNHQWVDLQNALTGTWSLYPNFGMTDASIVVSTKEINNISNMQVYPNPSSSQVFVKLSLKSSENVRIELMNTMGQLVYSSKVTGKNINTSVNVSNLSTGIYMLNVITSEGIKTTKLQVK